MKKILFILIVCAYCCEDIDAENLVTSPAATETAAMGREKSGKLGTTQMMRVSKTVNLDFPASKMAGEVSNICDQGPAVGIVHNISVSVNGKSYYPERDGEKDRAYQNIPLTDFLPEKPGEVICRGGEQKPFSIILPDNPRQEKGNYKYVIEYEVTSPDGGNCSWKFTERETLGNALK